MGKIDARLERAKQYLAIAESPDSKREAYVKAAEEIAAYREDTGATHRDIAISLGSVKKEQTVQKLLAWRNSGYEAQTPFLMDAEATKRAARSHAKTLLSDPSEATRVIASLPAEAKATVAKAVVEGAEREVYVAQTAKAQERLAIHGLDEDTKLVHDAHAGIDAAKERDMYPSRLQNAAQVLIALLEEAPEHLDRTGLLPGQEESVGAIIRDLIIDLRSEVDIAFAKALSLDPVQDGINRLLA
jgi:DNA-binding MarR family transcriptional regulator